MASLGALVGGPLGEEDVEELRSERSIRGLKSQEEIERLTVDENLDDIERAVLLLSSGVEIQKLSIINNLSRLLGKNSADVNRKVIPVLREYLYTAPVHVQLEAANSFSRVIQDEFIPPYMFASSFLPVILHNIENRDTGQLSQSVNCRLASCKLLGQIAPKIKKELVALVASLCQDVDYEVRACMCQQLETIARALGLESTQSIIIPELVELTNDEETINLDEGKKRWFLEFYKRMSVCGNPNRNNRVGSVTLALQGSALSGATIDDDPDAECRRCCAFNFPAMLLFCGAQSFQAELAATFHFLVEDPHALVRRTIACGFHEVAKLLGTNVGIIQQDLSILLKDESIEVLEGLIPNLPESLECLATGGRPTRVDAKLNNLSNLIPSLIACELAVDSSSNWRLHVQLLEKFSCFPKCLTSEQIYYKFVPLFFRLLSSNRVLPVKLAAAHTLCVFIRYNRRFEQRQELCCRLIQECGRGKSFRSRLLFIDICKFIMELFSRRFFKENFFEFLLELGSDPVLNVRLKFCNVPPRLKSLLKLPTDRHLLQQLEQCEEKDKEDLSGANKAADPRKKISREDKSKKAGKTKI
ncbi:Serine/threonine-protein phosphatase 4 regulatory subunit 4 [Acropora cervicornis]|uniref:Serine/threonine-protein phosphatase 4 regulatory subunit 4 n=1 Tax=Acropora cervicornis TaxID=6130 RepID=A0AAD9QFT8_ACRCE|nr:Serine/threonine-protein phosphatase 4 regulatory subunit 4 [Acropora cervicornis]